MITQDQSMASGGGSTVMYVRWVYYLLSERAAAARTLNSGPLWGLTSGLNLVARLTTVLAAQHRVLRPTPLRRWDSNLGITSGSYHTIPLPFIQEVVLIIII